MKTLTKRDNEKRLFPSLISDFFDTTSLLDIDFPLSEIGKQLPAVNIKETPKDYKIEMAAPGMKKEDFKIEVENHTLKIDAETEETKEDKDEKYSRREYRFNSFSRSFTLPDSLQSDKINAKYENGILTVDIAKNEATISKPKLIHIQ